MQVHLPQARLVHLSEQHRSLLHGFLILGLDHRRAGQILDHQAAQIRLVHIPHHRGHGQPGIIQPLEPAPLPFPVAAVSSTEKKLQQALTGATTTFRLFCSRSRLEHHPAARQHPENTFAAPGTRFQGELKRHRRDRIQRPQIRNRETLHGWK